MSSKKFKLEKMYMNICNYQKMKYLIIIIMYLKDNYFFVKKLSILLLGFKESILNNLEKK